MLQQEAASGGGAAREEEEEKQSGDGVASSSTLASTGVDVADVKLQSGSSGELVGLGQAAEQQEEEGDGGVVSPCPLPRINPCVTVRGNTLYVYGGLLEVGGEEGKACWSACPLAALVLIRPLRS